MLQRKWRMWCTIRRKSRPFYHKWANKNAYTDVTHELKRRAFTDYSFQKCLLFSPGPTEWKKTNVPMVHLEKKKRVFQILPNLLHAMEVRLTMR